MAVYFLIGIEAFLHRKLGQLPADAEEDEGPLAVHPDDAKPDSN